ncbi:MAG: IclR family transcriptional regulator [Terriglobia bacterium]
MPTRNHVDLVERTMRVLEALAGNPGEGSLKSIAARAHLVKSSAFRILYTLKEMGYVHQAEANEPYRPSPKLAALTRKTSSDPALLEIARPHLNRLRDEVWESAWLGQLRHGKVILVEVAEASHALRVRYEIGNRCPWHATSLGKAIAAHLSPAELEFALGEKELPRFTPHTITSRSRLREELARVRQDGFAVNAEETNTGATIFGAPVFDAQGRIFAAVSLGVPTARCSPPQRAAIIAALKKASGELKTDLARLGYRAPEPETTVRKIETRRRERMIAAE